MKKTTFLYIMGALVALVGVLVYIDSSKTNMSKSTETLKNNNYASSKEVIKEEVKEEKKEETIVSEIQTTDAETTQIEEKETVSTEVLYSSKDTDVIDTLEDTLNKIKTSPVTEKFTNGAKKTFIDLVDFIFYGGTIKGYTFEELTDNGKAKVLEIANDIDEAIESKVPNYKETISDKATKAFKSAALLIKKGSANLNNFMKEKLSEENYNAIIDAKDDIARYSNNAVSFIKDNGGKLLTTAKEKLSSWYNNLKSNQ